MFFRSLLLFSCHTSMQHGHSDSVGLAYTHRLSAHIDAFFLWYTQSSTHLHKSHTPTTQQSPLAPTHLMFSSYYVKMDTHNCAGTVCCFCWRLSAAPMSLTEVITVAGTTNLHRSIPKYVVSVRSSSRDRVVWF